MGFSSLSSPGESVIVVMDANRNKGSVDALNWALNHVVRPKDTVVVLGILGEFGKKSSCFPFYMGIGISSIWERLEFSGQGEMTPKVLEEEIAKKREQYRCNLQPFYRQCKKNEVKLEVKLAAGFDPKKITIEEAQNSKTRWIVLDSHLKKDKAYIYEHVGCNIAVIKDKEVATIMPSRAPGCERIAKNPVIDGRDGSAIQPKRLQDEDLNVLQAAPPPPSSCWYPLSWRTGFPRNFTYTELETITSCFDDGNVVFEGENMKLYQGILQETPVLVKCFYDNDERFWSELKILSRVRHRNILNLVGYCCTDAFVYLLQDCPCNGSLDMHLLCDEKAKNLPWKSRWDIALGIGGCLRYLHEECLDGPVLHLLVCSSRVLFSHDHCPMLTDFTSAKLLKDDVPYDGVPFMDGKIECPNLEEDERLSFDVHGYGLLLLELITGQRGLGFHPHGEGQTLVDWALPLLENGSLSQVMDPRLMDIVDTKEVHHMACAALLCLKNDSGNRLSMSEVLAVVRGDRFGLS
ncbi:hypothetical protein HHK36_007802 [Tetracentron sinense]|uniref:Protein kinase domain-containing protein n=1 Tax=Tetracentron sinense TaxID=13715 RepID=A0A834ZEG3_TETSI|nr:hypothetical protein HHK36_007802 [Tetracentron sinense]